MSLYPVTKQMIWQMIENERRLGEPFTLQGAIASYLYDLITGSEMSQRNYVKVWRWSYKKVRMNWAQITDTAALIYENGEGRNRGALRAQNDAIQEQNEGIGAHEGRTRGAHLQSTNNISIPKNSDNQEELSVDASAREESAPSPFDLSFLSDRDRVYESDIRECLANYQPSAARELLIHRWRRARIPAMVTLADLLTNHGWEVFASAVVISSDTERPTLPFFSSILQRLTTQRHEQQRQNIRPEVSTGGDLSGGGIPIYDLTAHVGRAMPGGVPPRGAGSHQSQSRRQSAFKKPGERSRLESLYANGYTDHEIAAMYPEEFGYLGPVGSSYRGAGDDEAPTRPLITFRSGGGQGAA